jgi:CHAD domain-containing protein
VRELDVQLLLIDELHVSGRRAHGGLGRVGVGVSKARDDARKKLMERMPVTKMVRLAKKLAKVSVSLRDAERASSKTAARSWRWAIDARVAKRAARLSAAVADAGGVYLPDRLHHVRLAVKKLRYAVELATEVAGERGTADLRLLKRLQDLLGRMHDVQMLVDEVRRTQASLTPPSVAVWRNLDALVTSLEEDCRRLHARYMQSRDALVELADRRSDPPHAYTGRAQTRRAG